MATRAIKPKRDDKQLGGWQSLPERAPSVLRADRPFALRLVAFAALVLTAVGGLAMILPSFNRPYLIDQYWGLFFFSVGVLGLIYHALGDREIQYRRTYAVLGLVLLFMAVILRFWPPARTVAEQRLPMARFFLPYGIPCLALALVFLLAVLRHETDAFWRKLILRVVGIAGAVMVVAGFLFSNVNLDFGFLQNRSSDYLQGEGTILVFLGLFYVAGFIAMQEPGNQLAFKSGLAMGGIGLFVFLLALWRSLYPTIMDLPPDQAYLVPEGLILMGLGLVYLIFGLGVCCDWVPIVMTRRELAAYFYSPIGYLVILGMTLVGWFMFATFVNLLALVGSIQEPIVFHYIMDFIPIFCLIFVVPVLTMRLLSEEKRSGTLEVLLTAPVNEVWVVLSKFIGSWIFFLIALAPWGLYLVALRVVGKEAFDFRPMLSFFISLGVVGAGFLAIGLFFSSVTKNQIISAVLTFALIIALTVVFWLGRRLGPPWNDIFGYISYLELWLRSMEGQFAPRLLMFHLSVAVFFLYLTTKVLEARKWT